jgi:translocation and assembly module TamB
VPIRVELRELRVDTLTVHAGGEPLAFAPVAASAKLGVTQHTVALRELGTPWARVTGDAAVGAWAPFRVHGRLRLRELPTAALESADLTLNGPLQRIEIDIAPRAPWLAGRAAAVVEPFAPAPLSGLTLALTDVNLAALDPSLPATRATLDARLAAGEGAILAGPVSLANALAGTLDAGRVPVSAATATARFDGERLRLDDLDVVLGEAGRATGQAEAGPDGYTAELATAGLRLDRLHSGLRPLAPAGTVSVRGIDGGQRVEARLREGEYALELAARLLEPVIEVDAAQLTLPGGSASVTGRLTRSGEQAFRGTGRLVDFDPSRLVNLPPARLNATFEASGALAPAFRADIAWRIADSRYAGAPLAGDGRVTIAGARATVPAARLQLGVNRLRAEGRYGGAGDRLNVTLDAPDLAQLSVGARGALRASGWLGGTPADPAFVLDAEGERLAWRDAAAAQRLTLKAQAPDGLRGRVEAALEATGLSAGGRTLARAEGRLAGSRGQHVLQARVDDPALAASVEARGALAEPLAWSGTVETLEAARPVEARLAAPLALNWRPGRLETGGGALALAGGAIRFEPLTAGAGALASRGRIEGIALADLLGKPRAGAPWRTDLVVSGDWDVNAAETLNGRLRLGRDRGDVTLGGPTPLALGVGELTLTAEARDNAVEATLRGKGDKLGELAAELRTRVERSGAAWVAPTDAPLALDARFTLPNLSWLGPLLAPDLRTAGAAAGRITASGTLREPRLAGQVDGERLRLAYGGSGVRLADGVLRMELEQDKVYFRRIAFRGGDGTLTASGEATFANGKPQLDLDFSAEQLAAVRRDDQTLVVSGRGNARARDGVLALTGEFTADRGLIELRPEGAPALSSDVVIVSGEGQDASAPTRVRLDVTLNLGDEFFVRGQGLDARLTGGIRVTMAEDDPRPRGRGVVRVAEGRYTAYGVRLAIERGALLFDGPLDNPRLDILAVRRNQQVEAGVAITGTALSPRTALYSNPPVPDAQKLQWLVLGSGPSGVADVEFGLAGSGARFDETVSLGTQLASAVYVSVGRSLRTAGTFVQATLELTDRVAVQGRTGAENAVTLFYVWSFD